MTSEEKIAKVLDFALRYGGIDSAHHKAWVIDQMIRALTDCPVVRFSGTDAIGQKYECDCQGVSLEYVEWVRRARDGKDGPNTYDWDVGIPP